MSRDFYFGYFTCFVVTQFYMDMKGKELYLKTVEDYWMDTSPYIWAAVWFLGFVFYTFIEVREKLRSRR